MDKTLGVVTCASSLCHGSIAPWNGSLVSQNEYVVWSRLDKHARAYKLLLNEQSKRIAAKLGLAAPAHESKVCLDCHAHNPLQSKTEHHISDGVACEACHGGAERWIGTHTEAGNSHAKNLANGMYPSDQPLARAQLCLSCHFGDTEKYVTHRMMAAGHPRLSFELNTFTSLQPAHFKVDTDYVQRKGTVDGVKIWSVGQAVAVATQLSILMDPKRGRDGAFPELTLFDCHACHHPMADTRWTPRTTLGSNQGPGLVRLNDSSILMLYLILRQTEPASAENFKLAVSQLNQAIAGRGDMAASAATLKIQAQAAAQKLSQSGMTDAQLAGVALLLVDDGLNGSYSDYAGAEQATMALGSVVSLLNQQGKLKSAAEMNRGLASLRASLVNDEKFKPSEFQLRLRAIRPQLVSGITKQNAPKEQGRP
ncbi:MAG: hypothetical protein CFE43_10595 [Burkholderiales bacterium PBB3]|nr:MAG: hypothetical protein CFE43_10595 [Burkholderiales bacterium PBB3]